MPPNSPRQTIVFAGGGHAHLYSLLRTGQLVEQGHDVVLVSPSRYLHYSGMATGVISGFYSSEEDRIDVRRLVERGDGRFVEGKVARVLSSERTLLLEDGRRVTYDVASFCLGSEEPEEDSVSDGAIPVKPVESAAAIRDRILGLEDGSRVLVAGGGAAGCEVAANAAALMEGAGLKGGITLCEAGPALLDASPKKARREILAYLRSRGAEVFLNTAVTRHENGVAFTGDGREIRADLLVRATGIVPSAVFRRSGLLTGDGGGLWVDARLRSVNDHRLFGGGDAISFRGYSLPRLGVFAIRQGPVLFQNLQRALRAEPLQSFEPQRNYLYVLNLGDGTGLAVYGPIVWRGRSAMKLKHLIDRRFIERHR